MTKKKKVLLWVFISILALIVAGSITLMIISSAKKKSLQKNENIENVTDTNLYNKAIVEGIYSQNYEGIYNYDAISEITYSDLLTSEEISLIWKKNGNCRDSNEFVNYLYSLKNNNYKKESIVFSAGNFTKNLNGTSVENGFYYGDDNYTLIKTDKNVYFASLYYSKSNNAISLTNPLKNDGTILYIFENVYSLEKSDKLLFTITYRYKLQEPALDENDYIFDYDKN